MFRMSLLTKAVMVSLAVVLLVDSSSLAQPRPGRGPRQGRGPGGFEFPGRGNLTKATLLRSEQVRNELKVSEDQFAKINEATEGSRPDFRELFQGLRDLSEEERRAKLEEIRKQTEKASEETNKKIVAALTDEQNKRLEEIILQQRGLSALTTDEKLIATLKISNEQKQQINDLFAARREMEQDLFSGLQDLSREERREKFEELRTKRDELRDETDKAVLEVLNASQLAQYEQMKGKPFELDRRSLFSRGFRGRNRPGDGDRRRPGGGDGARPRRPGGSDGDTPRRPRRPDA